MADFSENTRPAAKSNADDTLPAEKVDGEGPDSNGAKALTERFVTEQNLFESQSPQVMGIGGTGQVIRVTDNGIPMAVKLSKGEELRLSPEIAERNSICLEFEENVVGHLNTRGVACVPMLDWNLTRKLNTELAKKGLNKRAMAMDFVDGQDLGSFWANISSDYVNGYIDVSSVFSAIANSLDLAAQEGIFHMDLKAPNIKVIKYEDGEETQKRIVYIPKILDWGSCHVENSKLKIPPNYSIHTTMGIAPIFKFNSDGSVDAAEKKLYSLRSFAALAAQAYLGANPYGVFNKENKGFENGAVRDQQFQDLSIEKSNRLLDLLAKLDDPEFITANIGPEAIQDPFKYIIREIEIICEGKIVRKKAEPVGVADSKAETK